MAADDPRAGLPAAPSNTGQDPAQGNGMKVFFDERPANSRRIKTFGDLARWITDCTSRMLVTFLILAAGLSFGLQVIRWWKEPPAPMTSSMSGDLTITPEQTSAGRDGEGMRVSTEQGNLRIIAISGSQAEACRKAEELCLAVSETLTLPQTPPSLEEQRLLERLAVVVPVRSSPDGTRVFRYPGHFPMWAIIRPESSPRSGPTENHKDAPLGANDGDSSANNSDVHSVKGPPWVSQRVIGWAVLMQAGGNLWSLYVLTPTQSKKLVATVGRTSSSESMREPLNELPVGARWVARFAFSSENWVGIFEETVSGKAATWPLWIDQQLSRDGWNAVGRWNASGYESWRRYLRSGDATVEEHLTVRLRNVPGEASRGVVVYLRHSASQTDGN
ncbi:hypothetical protein [Thermogutta sp.]|uniref:hypothetical protein n=1 Tax=Thermogutta sp. TaxID=1962930 RepID=UPI003220930A